MDAPQLVPTLPPAPPSAPSAPAWAPPGTTASGATAPGATAPPSTPLSFEPVDAQPKRSRGPLFALIAVVALVVAGLGAVLALRGGDDGGATVVAVEDTSAFSLAAATQRATEATTARFEMDMSIGGVGDISMSGGIDNEAQIMTLSMDMGAVPGGAGFVAFESIIDVGNGVMYMGSPSEMGFPTDAAWISMDLAEVAEQSGMSLEDFQDQFVNPLDVAELFADVDAAVDVGADTIDGVAVRHYVVTVDLADVVAANPQLEQEIDLIDLGGLPEEVEYDVWVTEDNQLRRMTFAIDVVGQEMFVEMNVTGVGEPLDVQIPSPDDVMDLTELLGGF